MQLLILLLFYAVVCANFCSRQGTTAPAQSGSIKALRSSNIRRDGKCPFDFFILRSWICRGRPERDPGAPPPLYPRAGALGALSGRGSAGECVIRWRAGDVGWAEGTARPAAAPPGGLELPRAPSRRFPESRGAGGVLSVRPPGAVGGTSLLAARVPGPCCRGRPPPAPADIVSSASRSCVDARGSAGRTAGLRQLQPERGPAVSPRCPVGAPCGERRSAQERRPLSLAGSAAVASGRFAGARILARPRAGCSPGLLSSALPGLASYLVPPAPCAGAGCPVMASTKKGGCELSDAARLGGREVSVFAFELWCISRGEPRQRISWTAEVLSTVCQWPCAVASW